MKQITLINFFITFQILSLFSQENQNAVIHRLSFNEMQNSVNTVNDRNILMKAKEVFSFQPKMLRDTAVESEILILKNNLEAARKLKLYRWDSKLIRWTKYTKVPVKELNAGKDNYYSINLSEEGIYGLFEEIPDRKKVVFETSGNYKMRYLKFTQCNEELIYEFKNTSGKERIEFFFNSISPISEIKMELISPDGKLLEIAPFKTGKYFNPPLAEQAEAEIVFSLSKKIIQQLIHN